MPTRGFEPPHPVGQQILSLSRLPIPPRRRRSQADGIILPILWVAPAVICLTPEGWRLFPCRVWPDLGIAAATRPSPKAQPTRLAPGRTLTQPGGLPRPLVGSYPTGSPLTRKPGGIPFCCGCGRAGLRRPAPTCCFVGRPHTSRCRESGSSSGRNKPTSDGSPIHRTGV